MVGKELKISLTSQKCEQADITEPEKIGQFSLYGTSENYSIQLDESNARWLGPNLLADSIKVDLTEGLENYIPRDQPFNRIEPLLSWCTKVSEDFAPPLNEVTCDADFVMDRTTLTKIALLPYETNSYGLMIHCCRIGNTIFLCPYRVEEEVLFYSNPGQLKFSYTREKLRNIISIGQADSSDKRPVDGNIFYQHVNSATLSSASSTFKLLYSGQVDLLEGDKPLEIRIQTGKLGHGTNWKTKAMKWYFQSVFVGADKFLVGIRPKGEEHVVAYKKFASEKIRAEAELETNKWWNRKQCLGFVCEVLKKISDQIISLPESAALIIKHEPQSDTLSFEEDRTNENNFLTNEFRLKFGYD